MRSDLSRTLLSVARFGARFDGETKTKFFVSVPRTSNKCFAALPKALMGDLKKVFHINGTTW
jgi:hypothetical protein